MKKVLFITYYWPPAGGAPVNRIFKFSQYLPEFGWEPVILTTESGDFPFMDESLLKEANPETRIYRSAGLSLHKLFKIISPKSSKNFVPYGFTDASKNSFMDNISRWVKYNFIPDTRYPWRFSTVSKAVRIIKEEKIDLIFSSSPPQTNHIIARKAAKRTGIPWVADFRDPWTDVFWLLKNSVRWKIIHSLDKRVEKRTIRKMNAISTVGPALVRILQRKTSKNINLIYNGFDERYFNNVEYERSGKFRIIYAGSLSSEENPECFFKSLELLNNNQDFRNEVDILFLGNFPAYLNDVVDQSSFRKQVRFSPYTHYAESIKHIINSELLLMIVPDTADNDCILTSKLFEYLGASHPVIGFGPANGDASSVLIETGAGKMFDYFDHEAASVYILSIYNEWKENISSPEKKQNDKILRFSRRNLTAQLAELFSKTVEEAKE